MLINALNNYYDILEEKSKKLTDLKTAIPPAGMSVQGVTHRIMLNVNGTIDSIEDIRIPHTEIYGKKEKTVFEPRYIFLPERTQKPGIDLNIIEHRPLYIFGLNYDKKTGEFSPEDDTAKAKKSHECLVQGNLEFTEGMTSEIVMAYRAFLQNWNSRNEIMNKELIDLGKAYPTANFCFGLSGHPDMMLHSMDGEIMTKVRTAAKSESEADGICSISGAPAKIARLHDKIKGVRGGQSSGGLLVCFNSPSEESYGKQQSYNGAVSEAVVKRYASALNSLIANKNHHMFVDDMTVVFWAQDVNYDDSASQWFSEVIDANELNDIIKTAVEQMLEGKTIDFSSINIDSQVEFFIVGLTPNVSRISQKFLYKAHFGKLFSNIIRHQADMMIEGSKGQIPMWRMAAELKTPNSKNEKLPPPLLAGIFHAILSGGKYPEPLLETVIRRVKTDKSINYVRAGIIKACLNRKKKFNNEMEEFKMSLDTNCKDAGYLCGRLFAVLERIQEQASDSELNRTIKDSYLSSASSSPASVLPNLLNLANNHMEKIKSKNKGYYVKLDKLICEIMDKFGAEFPSTLTANEQGAFHIGYYHQRQAFFNSKKENNE